MSYGSPENSRTQKRTHKKGSPAGITEGDPFFFDEIIV